MPLKMKRMIKTLENGMQVILIEKPGYARSMFMIGAHAGSTNLKDDQNGIIVDHPYGCAHYLEHKMFRYNGHDVTYDLAEARAKTNAFTGINETCYYVTTNADPRRPLELLIDFVQTLDIDQESVDKEKGIILSEYYSYDQDPTSRLLKETFRSLYHVHPMRDDVLGKPEDISAMRVEDLQAFYDTWYDPSQLALVGVTGYPIEEVFSWIEEHEKAYPSAFSVRSQKILPDEPETICRKSAEVEMDVDLCYACLGVKLDVLEGDQKDIVRKDYMLNMYLTGMFSTMNPDAQRWLDEQIVGSVFGSEADLDRDHAYLLVYAQSGKPQEFFSIVRRILEEKKPLGKDEFESILIREKATAIRLMDNYDSLCQQSVTQCFEGCDPFDDIDILSSITLESLNDFIASLDFSRIVETLIVPEKKD